jgi:uncharacterized protein
MELLGGEGEAISASACWELLGSVSIGRLSLSIRAMPVILPVQYYLDGEELAICLGYGRVDPRSVDAAVVAFAADALDPMSLSGWTVQVQGLSRLPQQMGVPVDCGQPAAGQMIQLAPSVVTGHRVRLCPYLSGLPET